METKSTARVDICVVLLLNETGFSSTKLLCVYLLFNLVVASPGIMRDVGAGICTHTTAAVQPFEESAVISYYCSG